MARIVVWVRGPAPDRISKSATGPGSYLQIVLWVRGRPWIVSPDRTLGPGPAPGRISGSYFCLGFCYKLMKSKVRIGDTICYKVRSGDTIGDPAPDPKYDLGQGLGLARAGGGGEGWGGRGAWGGVGWSGVGWVVVAKQRPLIKTGIWFLCVRCRLLKTAAAVIEDARPTPTPTPTYPHPTVPCPYSPLPSPPLSPPLIYLYRDDGSDTCSLVARFFMATKRVPAPYRPYAYAHLNIHYYATIRTLRSHFG